MTLILLTNDDGIEAEGLRVLEESTRGLGDTLVVAPDRERSAVSHGLTVRVPLEVKKIDASHYAANGTPADCVIYALRRILQAPPDLVISGINHGANLGDDIMYSGTVAAAREASRRGFAAIAISQAYDENPISFKAGTKFIKKLVKMMLEQKSDGGICLNVNVPVGSVRGVKITRHGCALHYPHFNSLDRGEGGCNEESRAAETRHKSRIPPDYQAITEQYISVTPLQRDQTDYATAELLLKDGSRLLRGLWAPGIGLIR